MFRLFSIAIESLSSAVFLVPTMLLLQYALWKQCHFYRTGTVILFALYLSAVFSATGIPTINTINLSFDFNLVPLADLTGSPAAYIKNTVLNILLFVPMGILLPAIWDGYRSFKRTALTGLAISLLIEILQIFTFRLTDVDDLITNTLGTISGYGIKTFFSFPLLGTITAANHGIPVKYEPLMVFVITLLVCFFLQPIVSGILWEIIFNLYY